MLESLLGSKTVEKILIFLLVNERCYARELQAFFQTSLSAVQKALLRLEKGQIILSEKTAKQRLFRLNPSYFVFNELEALLKATYNALPLNEKKNYYTLNHTKHNPNLLHTTWKNLQKVTLLSYVARSFSKNPIRKGTGEVIVHYDSNATIIFEEKGVWKDDAGLSHNFTNSFRWMLHRLDNLISLEHLRHGPKNPVFLFNLAPHSTHLQSIDPHLCGPDTYFGKLKHSKSFLELNIRALGHCKNDEITHIYT